jgi:hypothetical protein
VSDITVTVSGGDGSSSVTAGVGDTINVTTSPLAGPLPELQLVAGSGITVASKNGVSTISANFSELSIPANLADLADVSAGATSGQVLSYSGTSWGGLTLSIPVNLADLSNVNGTPTTGQVLAWDGSVWAPSDDQTGGSSNVANLADLADVSSTPPETGQALVWGGSEWAGGNIPPGTTVNGLSGAVNLVSGGNVAITVDGQNLTIASVGGGDRVTALNGLTGSLTLTAGDGVTIANSGSTITLNATADLNGYATEAYVDSAVANLVNGSTAALDTLAELANALNNDSDFATTITTSLAEKAALNHDHVRANITDLTTSDLDMQGSRVLFANVYSSLADLPSAATYHGMFAHVHSEGAAYYAHDGAWVRLANQSEIPTVFVSGLNGLAGPVTLAAGTNVQIGQSGNQLTISSTAAFSTLNGESGELSLVGDDGVSVATSGGTITVSGSGLATEGFVNQAVAALVNSAPQTLDTLAELANALNNDSDFAANVTTLISQKADANHDHDIANVTGLQDALDAKADLSSLAAVATSGNYGDLSNVPSEFPPSAHSHEIASVTGLQSALDAKASLTHSHVKANITDLTTGDLDMQGSRVLFANYYATQANFPDPTVYHGMVAHSHADGAFYGAHAGAWVRLANQNEIPSATSVNALTGDITLVAGDNINVTTSGQNITITGQQAGIVWQTPPQSGSSPGNAGDIAYDDNYIYLRTSQAWRQVALSPISTSITISQQPTNQSVDDGDTATFTVLATAAGETITYQWKQSSDNGSTFADISGATSNSLTVTANLSLDGYRYSASLSAPGAADVTSGVATLTVAETFDILAENGDRLITEGGDSIDHDGLLALTITQQPQNTTAVDGNATFTSRAEMSDGTAVTYQWQELIGGNWTDIAGETSQNLTLTGLLASDDGEQYRVVADGDQIDPVISNAATLATPQFLTITLQPQNTTAIGGNATFTSLAEMSDGTAVTYQWQELIGGNWTDIAGETGQNLALTALVASDDGEQYRVIADGDRADPVTSNVATLTAPQVVSFTAQPQNTTAIDGNATFTALAEMSDGTAVTYQWQELIGGNWTDIAGETGQNLALTALVASDDGEQYRVIADGDRADPVTSNVATLTMPGAWRQVGADIDGEAADDRSGVSVAMSSDGSRVAIGANLNDGAGFYAGHVRVYDLTGSTWTQVGADIDGEAAGDSSGISVAMSSDGSRVAIGAYLNHGAGTVADSGHVRVYDLTGSTWTQVGADIDGEAADDRSGISVAMSSDGSRVAIGANANDGTGTDAGHVRVYDLIGSTWTQVGADIDGEAAGDFSGRSVAMSSDGSRVAIGANANDGTGANAGHVRVYDLIGSTWTQVGADIDGEAAGDSSGISVAMSSDGSRVAIGANGNDGTGTNAGHVRVFEAS